MSYNAITLKKSDLYKHICVVNGKGNLKTCFLQLTKYKIMDPECSFQDVVRCHLCETPTPPLHCDVCDKYLCDTCKAEHLFDESKHHRVVPFKMQRSTTKCKNHSKEICELFCEQSGITICALCFSSKEYQTLKVVDILTSVESKKRVKELHLS